MYILVVCTTVEPLKTGHFRTGPFVLCSEVVPISEVNQILIVSSSKMFRYGRQFNKMHGCEW